MTSIQQLLLAAKGIAIHRKVKRVTPVILFAASDYFEIAGNKKAVSQLLDKRRRKAPHKLHYKIDSLIRSAGEAPPMEMSPETKELIRFINNNALKFTLRLPNEENVSNSLFSEGRRIYQLLTTEMYGQEKAAAAISRYLTLPTASNAVRGAMVFAGVAGKSMAAELIARGLGYNLIAFDCASVVSPLDATIFEGNPTTISGSKPGQLTDYVRRFPESVVVFENVDKMHPQVQASIVQNILSTGRLTDLFGFYDSKSMDCRSPSKWKEIASPQVDFSKTIIILTVDCGKEITENSALLEKLEEEGGENAVGRALGAAVAEAQNHNGGAAISPGLMPLLESNALFTLFRPLDFAAMKKICRKELTKAVGSLRRKLGQGHAIKVEHRNELADLLILSGGGESSPRTFTAQNIVEQLFGTFFTWCFSGKKLTSLLRVTIPDEERSVLKEIRHELGNKPIRRLFRTMQRLNFAVEVKEDNEELLLIINEIRLVKVAKGSDYSSHGGLLVELPEDGFSTVAGHKEVKQVLCEQMKLLQYPQRLRKHNMKPPAGAIMYGSPGTGKTSLARAFAAECKLPFIAVTGAELLDMKFQREVFRRLRRYSPACLFIDELDAIGSRGQGFDPAINTLLAELDGFNENGEAPVFTIGATNRKDKIDQALMRSGRLELQLEVNELCREGRRSLLNRIAEQVEGGISDVVLDFSEGMSGAQLAAVNREVVLLQGCTEKELLQLLCHRMFGGKKHFADPVQRQMVAWHEAGHAVVMHHFGLGIKWIAIANTKNALGMVRSFGRGSLNKKMVPGMLAGLFAGRLAEEMKWGSEGADTGAASDISRATSLAREAVARFGFDSEVGLQSLDEQQAGLTPELVAQVEKRSRIWLAEAEKQSKEVLAENFCQLQAVAEALLERDILTGADLEKIVGDVTEERLCK